MNQNQRDRVAMALCAALTFTATAFFVWRNLGGW